MVAADREGKPYGEVADHYNAVVSRGLPPARASPTTCSRARRRSTTSWSRRTCSGRCTSTGRSSSARCSSRSRRLTGHTLPDRYIEGTCPICGYPEARGDQCDNCGNQLDPSELIEPRSQYRRLGAGVPADEASLPRPAAVRRAARRVDLARTTIGGRTSATSRSRCSTRSARARSRATSTGACGSPCPGYAEDENKRIYVWFDAVIGYLSASIEWAAQTGRSRGLAGVVAEPGVRALLLPGKGQHRLPHRDLAGDAARLRRGRRVYGAGRGQLELPDNVVATEFLTMEGKQFSSSRGYTIFVRDFLDRYDADALRYYLVAAGPETQDTDFTWADFVRRNNDELLANWGNLVNRTLTNAYRTFGAVPEPGALTRARTSRCSRRIAAGFDEVGGADRARPLPRGARRGDAALLRGQPVPQRAGALGAREDRPRARRDGPLRRAAGGRQPQGDLHAVPPAHLPDGCTSCSATRAGIAGPLEFRTRDRRRTAAATRC